MEKEEKFLFYRVFIFVILIFLINFGGIIYKQGGQQGFTGFSIKSVEKAVLSIGKMPQLSQIFLIAQWSLLLLVLFYVAARDRVLTQKKKEIRDVSSYKIKKNRTDLDTLYEILKDKKSLRISTIAKSFKVDKDVALEWCKILESGEIAEMDYPGFGEPICRIKIKEKTKNRDSEEFETKTSQQKPEKSFLSFFSQLFGKKKKQEETRLTKNLKVIPKQNQQKIKQSIPKITKKLNLQKSRNQIKKTKKIQKKKR